MKAIKNFLNNITMYRLMLYFLLVLAGAAVILSFLGILPYSPWQIMAGGAYLWLVCYLSNNLFARLFGAKPNPESRSITALILTLLIGPMAPLPNIWFLTLAAVIAMASKYVIAFRKRHIFNPAAFAIVFTALAINQGASWWVGNKYLLPFVILGGVFLTFKIRRWKLVGSFVISYLLLFFAHRFVQQISFLNQGYADNLNISVIILESKSLLLNSPLLFFSFVMLPEPITSPRGQTARIYYGILIAILYSLFSVLLPTISYGLEMALLAGNIFARVWRFDPKFVLTLIKKEAAGSNIINFWFRPEQAINFIPGQFLEWTLPHKHVDSRGTRRYFTIASAPEEKNILLTTKFAPEKGSSFKSALKNLSPGEEITAGNLEGKFILPKDTTKKLCFIAGGIGITPFRSMVKYMINYGDCRDAILLYAVRTADEITYREIFAEAEKECGTKIRFIETQKDGQMDAARVKTYCPDFLERIFYVSGPESMVQSFEKMLSAMDVPKRQIKHDYFPGY